MTDTDGPLAFEPLEGEDGLEILDRIEQERCVCRTDKAVSPTAADGDCFHFPVDHAVEFSASRLVLPNVAGILVRNETGEIVEKVQQLDSATLSPDSYKLELLTQFKTYLTLSGSVEIVGNGSEFVLNLGAKSDVILGARSNHDRPAASITTTSDPFDVMAAVGTFGSALKTISPDRSLPSLRGHPPAVELGESLDIPNSVAPPETGIALELPPDLGSIYAASPLAYYLGAELDAGSTPKLVTDDGFEYALNRHGGYEATVERVLKQIFFLDCITRTEGLYELELHERKVIEDLIDIEFGQLYDQSLSKQVRTYLDVPYEVLAEHVPDWRLTTHVEPTPSTVEQLSFVVDDLAIVQTFGRHGGTGQTNPVPSGVDLEAEFTRSANSQIGMAEPDYVQPEAADSLEQAWIGEDIPVGASKLTRGAFENRLELTPTEGDISITIVLNDPRMDEERDLADQAYGNRENLPFDVNVNRDVTTDELRELLHQDTAFLHYIGHTERDGFECPDGKLDVESLDETGVQAFLLNACNSYEQGLGLIESGAVAGIVTLNDVINEEAVSIGSTIARLLNVGFPLRSALTVSRDESILGGQYIVVGDGGVSVSQANSGFPNLVELSRQGSDYHVDIETFATDVIGIGALYEPFISGNEEFYIGSGNTASFDVPEEELEQFLLLENVPVRIDGELHWSQSLDLDLLQ